MLNRAFLISSALMLTLDHAPAADTAESKAVTMAEVLAASKPTDWRPLNPENTLYVDLDTGRIVIELAPGFAPAHVANVKALAREHYYDGLAVLRVQDNYVVQWGDPEAEKPTSARKIQNAKRTLPGEFDRLLDPSLQASHIELCSVPIPARAATAR